MGVGPRPVVSIVQRPWQACGEMTLTRRRGVDYPPGGGGVSRRATAEGGGGRPQAPSRSSPHRWEVPKKAACWHIDNI